MLATRPLNPSPPLPFLSTEPAAHDWLIHPGGAAVLSALTRVLNLDSPEIDYSQTGPSWDIYRERGNSSSAAIGAVIERARETAGREGCVAVAFGPGISVEMAVLRRTGWKGRKAESAKGYANGSVNGANGHADGHVNGHANDHANGHANGPTNGANSFTNGHVPKASKGDASVGLNKTECVCLRSRNLFGGSGLDCWCRN